MYGSRVSMGDRGILSRPKNVHQISYPKRYDWRDDAACKDKPSHLFDIIEPGTPYAMGKTGNPLKILNRNNFAIAGKICSECPVVAQCEADAKTNGDDAVTYRAGKYPRQFSIKGQGRPRKEPEFGNEMSCARGHVGYIRREPSGRMKCRECARSSEREYRDKKRMAAGLPAKKERSDADACVNGHTGRWSIHNSRNRKVRQCLECQEVRRKAAKMKV